MAPWALWVLCSGLRATGAARVDVTYGSLATPSPTPERAQLARRGGALGCDGRGCASLVEGKLASAEDPKEAPASVQNSDRLTCLRQDDLDLVKPQSPDHAIRMVLGVNAEDTASDVYVSVDTLWLKRVDVTVSLKRKEGSDTFDLEVAGEESYEGTENVGAVDFWLRGVDILPRNSWMDWGASLVADRELLNKGQDGLMRFKLYGEGRAVFNNETGEWDIELLNKQTQPFYIKIDNQWVLEKVLNKFGGLDAVIMDNLWPAVAAAIPRSFAASMRYLNSNELLVEVRARISGSQEDRNKPLRLDVSSEVWARGQPARVLEVFVEEFDPAAKAQASMARLLREHNLTDLWESNKDSLAKLLKRYGVKLEAYSEDLDLDEVKRQILNYTKTQADFLVKAMQPFIKASNAGIDNFWEGLTMTLQADAGWDKSKNEGLMDVSIRAPDADRDGESSGGGGRSKNLEVPRRFIQALSAGVKAAGATASMVVVPKKGRRDTAVSLEQLNYRDGKLTCVKFGFQDLRMRSFGLNGTKPEVWKLQGSLRDTSVRLPASMQPDLGMGWASADARLNHAGNFTFDLGDEGIRIYQTKPKVKPPLPTVPLKPRRGKETDLDGPLPTWAVRPTMPTPVVAKLQLAPRMQSTSKVDFVGTHTDVTMLVKVEGTAWVDHIEPALKPALAARPTQDFGYVFFVGRFSRWLRNGEPNILEWTDVVAVVSCGYMRIMQQLEPERRAREPEEDPARTDKKTNPFAIVDFTPDNGQLQLELEKYEYGPDVERRTGSQVCLVLYSGGYPPRTAGAGWFSSGKEVDDRLCGDEAEVEQLEKAINLQRARFRADWNKTQAWNFGTHMHQDQEMQPMPQYLLPPGLQTAPLTELIRGAWR